MFVLEINNIVIIGYLGSLYVLLSFLISVIWSSRLCLFFTSIHTLLAKGKKNKLTALEMVV